VEYKLVIAVRDDLKLSTGKLAVQVAHAAVNCSMAAKKNQTKWYNEWYREGQKKVVVKVASEQELRKLQKRAEELDIPVELIQDAGLTELPPSTTTVLAIGPTLNEVVDPLTGNLPLL